MTDPSASGILYTLCLDEVFYLDREGSITPPVILRISQ